MRALAPLVEALKRLPGIGPKQAQRLAVHLLRAPAAHSEALIAALQDARRRVRLCLECCDYTDAERCAACSDPGRDRGLVCVVEQPQDVAAVERSRSYRGLYHVLHGCLSPLDGVGPDRLRLAELMRRLQAGRGVREVILATDADTEGEATALYLAGLLKPLGLRVSRIAQGVPLGGDLEYVDERTLTHALAGRREV